MQFSVLACLVECNNGLHYIIYYSPQAYVLAIIALTINVYTVYI